MTVMARAQSLFGKALTSTDELDAIEHDRHGKGSVIVWKDFNFNKKTDLYTIENGTLTALQ